MLIEDFILAARTFGGIIISEAHLPAEQKTIKPTSSLGGVIGGEKFLVHGILFKFSSDVLGIFSRESDVLSGATDPLLLRLFSECSDIFPLQPRLVGMN